MTRTSTQIGIATLDNRYVQTTGDTMTGNLLFTDNTLDIGASGATRPRTGYFGTSLVAPTIIAPSASLALKPTTNAVTAIQLQNAAGTSVLNVDTTNQRVGIGTTAPGTKLHLRETDSSNIVELKLENEDDANYRVLLGTSYSFAHSMWLKGRSGVEVIGVYSDNTYLGMGNVGIGTTSPTYLLSLGGGSARIFWMERHTTANTAGNTLTVQAGGATSGATDKAGGDLILKPGVSTGSGTGKVQILASPGVAASTTDNTLFETAMFGPLETVFNDTGVATLDFRVEGDTEANLLMVDASADAIGIGTASPGLNRLAITGGTGLDAELRIEQGVSTWGIKLIRAQASGDVGILLSDDVDNYNSIKLQAGTNNIILATTASGYVGIGDAAPGEALDVAGNIDLTGVLKVDDVQVVSNRVVDARCDDAINSGDATTDGVIDALRDALITHGLIAAA